MGIARRILLFLAVNFLVIISISVLLQIFHVKPYLSAYGLDIPSLLIFCLIWGMGGAFISLGLSRVMAKWVMGVKLIDPKTSDAQMQNLLATIERLSQEARLPDMPQVGIYESPEVNAFATGPSKRRSLVAVSRGLLNRMSQKELEGVLAHEISHVANGDMVTMTLIQGVVNAFVMFLARILAYVFSGIGKNREESSGSSYFAYTMMVFVFEIVFMLLGSIIIAWFSRFREYRADKGGAELAGKEKMISALQCLQALKNYHDPRAEKASFQTMKISGSSRGRMMELFSSHPPLEKRIEKLRELSF